MARLRSSCAAVRSTTRRFTPRALQKAMARQQHKDVTMANIDPLVDSAVKVLPNNIPDSGTASLYRTSSFFLWPKVTVGLCFHKTSFGIK